MTQPLTDAGVGRALFTTRFSLSLQAFQMCLLFGAVPALIAPFVLWWAFASPTSIDLVRLDALSHVYNQSTPARWHLRDDAGQLRVVEAQLADQRAVQWMTPPQARQVLAEPISSALTGLRWVKIASLLTGLLGFLGMNWFLRQLGGANQESERIRGALDVVPGQALSRIVRREGGGRYTLVDVALPLDAPQRGLMLIGAQGSGKSAAMHDLMRQVFKSKGRKVVIYDRSGEFFQAYFRPGIDMFFNPALEGSVAWSIFGELQHTYDADTMARAFLPPKSGVVHGGSAFFEDAARALFAAILGRLKARGAVNTRDIARAMLEMPAEEMEHLVSKSVASSAVGGDAKGQRQGVMSSIAIYLNGIAAVKPGTWTAREFVERDDDARLFILGTADTAAMFTPLYRLILATMFSAIESGQPITRDDKFWFFFDEVYTLGDMGLDEVLARLRKYGVSVVSGVQSDKQFVAAMGADRADTTVQCHNSVLVLAANDPGLQERCAKRLGRQEMEKVSRNQALAVNEMRDGAALTRNEGEKWLVMPSDIGSLDPCVGWLKLPGSFPVATVDYRSWLHPRWGRPARVKLGDPVVPLPDRDPTFRIVINDQGDPFERVAEEVRVAQEARAAEEADLAKRRQAAKGGKGVATELRPAMPRPSLRDLVDQDLATEGTSAAATGLAAGAISQGQLSRIARAGDAGPAGDAVPSVPNAANTAPTGGAGVGQRGNTIPFATGLAVDPDSGEIYFAEDVDVGQAQPDPLLMDQNTPGHTLGMEMGADDR